MPQIEEDASGDPTNRIVPPSKVPGRFVVFADRVTAVAPDAEAVARQRELAWLCLHISMRDGLVVHVELRLAERLAVRAGLLAVELHSEKATAHPVG